MVRNKFLAGIAALICAASAQALPTSLTANVTAGDHLGFGAAKSYAFNINDLLASNSLSSNAISFGQLTVFGHSDAAYNVTGDAYSGYALTTSTHYNAGACNHGNCNVTDYTYTRNHNGYRYDFVTDTMMVKVGDSTGSDTSEWQQSSSNWTSLDSQSGSDRFGRTTYQTANTLNNGSFSGDLSVTLNLDNKALSDLIADGILSLSIWSSNGQFNIDSMRLNLLAVDLPIPPTDAQVPVPTSLLLTGLGLAALATMRRRQA
jgi:LysM repeat protein